MVDLVILFHPFYFTEHKPQGWRHLEYISIMVLGTKYTKYMLSIQARLKISVAPPQTAAYVIAKPPPY